MMASQPSPNVPPSEILVLKDRGMFGKGGAGWPVINEQMADPGSRSMANHFNECQPGFKGTVSKGKAEHLPVPLFLHQKRAILTGKK